MRNIGRMVRFDCNENKTDNIPENLEILPYGLSISFKLNPDDINKKIKKRKFIRNKENDCCIIRTNAKFDISYNFFIHKLQSYK